jgi:hypothetical protein
MDVVTPRNDGNVKTTQNKYAADRDAGRGRITYLRRSSTSQRLWTVTMVTTFPRSAVFYLSCGTQQFSRDRSTYRMFQTLFHYLHAAESFLRHLTVTQLVKKAPVFYGTRWMVTLYSTLRLDRPHWFPSPYMFSDYTLKASLTIQCILHVRPSSPFLFITLKYLVKAQITIRASAAM